MTDLLFHNDYYFPVFILVLLVGLIIGVPKEITKFSLNAVDFLVVFLLCIFYVED